MKPSNRFDSTQDKAALESVRTDPARRANWLEEDPSKLFRLLALDSPTATDRSDFERCLTEAVRHPQSRQAQPRQAQPRQARSSGSRRWPWVASAAAMLALLFWAGVSYLPGVAPDPVPGPERGPALATVAETSGAAGAEPISSAPIQPAAFQSGDLHGIEVLATPGEARVVDLSIGQTRVVMIFDKELDL